MEIVFVCLFRKLLFMWHGAIEWSSVWSATFINHITYIKKIILFIWTHNPLSFHRPLHLFLFFIFRRRRRRNITNTFPLILARNKFINIHSRGVLFPDRDKGIVKFGLLFLLFLFPLPPFHIVIDHYHIRRIIKLLILIMFLQHYFLFLLHVLVFLFLPF